ncbi:MAG: MotA/TolQ/ExbB proton channel family protein [Bacteroidota bacterium]
MTFAMLFQDADSLTLPTDSLATTVAAEPEGFMAFVETVMQGGWVMIPIAVLSLWTIAVYIERLFTLRSAHGNTEGITDRVRAYVTSGDIGGAIAYCEAQDKPLTRILKRGLERLGRPIAEIKEALNAEGKSEAFRLEKRTGTLATIAGVAPMLGFFGTVTGMIEAFQDIQRLQGNVDPSVLAGGIWEALLTTAFGLITGILAFFAYNFLLGRIQRMLSEMERATADFIDLLQAPSPASRR